MTIQDQPDQNEHIEHIEQSAPSPTVVARTPSPGHLVTSATILRLGAAATIFVCQGTATQLWEQSNMLANGLAIGLAFVNYALMAVLLILSASVPIRTKTLLRLILPISLFVVGCRYYVYHVNVELQGTSYASTDVITFGDYAARLVRLGKNPYQYDLADGFRISRQPLTFNTPTINGDFTGKMAYPALSFLVYIPFSILGLSVGLAFPLFLMLVMIALYLGTSPPLRPLSLLPIFLDTQYLNYAFGGVNDIVWMFFLVLMIVWWKYPNRRALLFGLACASKQTPMFLVPFLLIRLWEETDPRDRIVVLARFAVISGGVFALFNAPYMLWDFHAWWEGVTEAYRANLIFFGQGLSTLTTFGRLPLSKSIYTVFILAGFGVSIYLYKRYGKHVPELLWAIPGVILWFGQRSLTSYWYYFILLFMFALARRESMSILAGFPVVDEAPPPATYPPKYWRPMQIVGGVTALALIGVLVWGVTKPASGLIRIAPPFVARGGRVFQLTVEVKNQSGQAIRPRFSVQSSALQPYFWHIDSGAPILFAGATNVYAISTNLEYETFDMRYGAEIIVSDADGYNWRAATFIDGEATSRYADAIPNGAFTYWQDDGQTPYFWSLIAEPQQPHPSQMIAVTPVPDVKTRANESTSAPVNATLAPPTALRLTLSQPTADPNGWASIKLDTWTVLTDDPLTMWVNPPAEANLAPEFQIIYGLELILADKQIIWVLFGDSVGVGATGAANTGMLTPTIRYIRVSAPRGQWSRQTLRLRSLVTSLGLTIPPPETITRTQQELSLQMVNLRLLLAARAEVALPISAEFGELSSSAIKPDAQALLEETLDAPIPWLLWRGEFNLEARNDDIAESYFRRAIEQSSAPSSAGKSDVSEAQIGQAYFGLAKTQFNAQKFPEASEAYRQSIQRRYRVAESYLGSGWSAYYLGDLEASRPAFLAAMQENPKLADAYIGLAYVSATQGACPEAKRWLAQAQAIAPVVVQLNQCAS